MLPEFKVERDSCEGKLHLTIALNCESIRPVYRKRSDLLSRPVIRNRLQLRNSP